MRNTTTSNTQSIDAKQLEVLESMNEVLHEIAGSSSKMPSQSLANDRLTGSRDYRNNRDSSPRNAFRNAKDAGRRAKGSFVDEFEKQIWKNVLGKDFEKQLKNVGNAFARSMGYELQDIPGALGKQLSQQLMDTKIGQDFKNKLQGGIRSFAGRFTSGFEKASPDLFKKFQEEFQKTQEGMKTADGTEAVNMSQAGAAQAAKEADKTASVASEGAKYESMSVTTLNVDNIIAKNSASSDDSSVADTANDLLKNAKDNAMQKVKDTAQDAVQDKVDDVARSALKGGQGAVGKTGAALAKGQATAGGAELVTMGAGGAEAGMAGAAGLEAGLAGVAGGLAAALPPILLISAGLWVLDKLLEHIGGILEEGIGGISDFIEQFKKMMNRGYDQAIRKLSNAQDRLLDDINSVVKEPFKILQQSTEALISTWESSMQTINTSQGYTKAQLQDLMSNYAARIEEAGLSSIVSSADLTSNLSKVLESGLSGKVAEEFAYMATILSEAVPTQDWFSFGETYASIAANAIKDGQSQSAAIELANNELEQFASNVLYASRQISGGFSTSLANASDLFTKSAQIAAASRTGDVSEISGVLTSVSAIVGAVAPDLASGLVDAIVNAATGGNSSALVSLRSLAGINASNTEFLQAFANDTKGIFENIFNNLGSMQKMSDSNYMEVAEGLSELFGMSIADLSRVDFNYLADAISAMNTNSNSLADNMALVADGQTKTSTEQLRIAQINKYALEEGLSYVLDNEVARSIQEHMWDEQMANEIMEATYSIEFTGKANMMMQKLLNMVNKLVDMFNPFSAVSKVIDAFHGAAESSAQQKDIQAILEAGKVGATNSTILKQLSATGKAADLNLTPSLATLMTGQSQYESSMNDHNLISSFQGVKGGLKSLGISTLGMIAGPAGLATAYLANKGGALLSNIINKAASSTNKNDSSNQKSITSSYEWGVVAKSAQSVLSLPTAELRYATQAITTNTSSTQAANERVMKQFESVVSDIDNFVDSGKSFEEWKESAAKGSASWEKLVAAQNIDIEKLEDIYEEKQLKKAQEKEIAQKTLQEEFNTEGKKFLRETFPSYQAELMASINEMKEPVKQMQKFMDAIATAASSSNSNEETTNALLKSLLLSVATNGTNVTGQGLPTTLTGLSLGQ